MKNAGVVGATMAWVASSGGVDGFDGVDGGGFDGVDGIVGGLVAWWRRWRRWLASLVVGGLGVFVTEGTDVEVPLCPSGEDGTHSSSLPSVRTECRMSVAFVHSPATARPI